jgi:hypothetical protein
MAKDAAKGKETTGKTIQKKTEKPAASKAAKAATKPSSKPAQAVRKVAAKKTPAEGVGKRMSPGEQYSCEVCGLIVSIDEACGCVEAHDIICCGEEMKAKR